jgi:hypothetical protein
VFHLPKPSRAGQATPKPHQCDIKASSKRVDSQPIGTPKPPRDECRMQNAECRKPPKARCKPGAGHQLVRNLGVALLCSSCVALVLLLCCFCFPLVLRWWPPPHHGGSVEPQVGIDCLGRLVIHMQSDFSINPLRSAVLLPSRSKDTLGRRKKEECRMQKGRQRHTGAKEEGRMQNDEWEEKTARSQDEAPAPTLTPERGGIGWRR